MRKEVSLQLWKLEGMELALAWLAEDLMAAVITLMESPRKAEITW